MQLTIHANRAAVVGLLSLLAINIVPATGAATLSAENAQKVGAMIETIKKWAAEPVVTTAVKTRNQAAPAALAGMTQEKWAEISVLDPVVRELSRNEAAKLLKSVKTDAVSEVFLNAADGTKVALLAKTSGWCHQGKAKHDKPMAGEVWTGDVEIDDSSGLEQVQVAVPVLVDGKPAGSLVVGLSIASLR